MRKHIIIMFTMLCYTALALAVPAKPGWHTMTQSDGTTLKIQAVGNAFNNALLTTDGLAVERGADGDFYYISSLTGLTAMRAHNPEQRTATEKAFVAAQRSHLGMTHKSYKMPNAKGKLGATGSNATADVPALGERRIPIILVEFQDKKFNHTPDQIIESMLTGHESVGQYFHDQSNGMYKPVFDVYGIYSLSQDREYYGGRTSSTKDKGIGWLVTEACQLAAADGVSFQPYDTNNDYYCDVVIVIFAGVGEAQASGYHPEAIWPCNWTLDAAKYYSRGGNGAFSPNVGDPYVNHFAVFNELTASAPSSTSLAIAWDFPTSTTRATTTTTAWATGTSCAWAAMPTTATRPWVTRPMKRCSWDGSIISLQSPIPIIPCPHGTRRRGNPIRPCAS